MIGIKNVVGKKKKKDSYRIPLSLTLLFSLAAFCVLLLSVGIAISAVYIISRASDIFINTDKLPEIKYALLFIAIISMVVGIGISVVAGRLPSKPINRLVTQMNRLAGGDFNARLHFGKPLGTHPAFAEIENSFNKMAGELGNTEMLRTDFVNNFSHEFKTPIVSISGFAKLLKRGNLTPEQQKEYINAIEEESVRLAHMATNVLNLSKIESQTILTDLTRFNLSEQIRGAVVLLEDKWSKKELELTIEFDEYEIEANEELLKQVWINLIDNAIKFSPDGGPLGVTVTDNGDSLSVGVSNRGEISVENQKKIWNKFYQADESHSAEGNGIGLAIVKRVVDLHGGEVTIMNANGTVTFTVELPKTQY